VKGKKTIRGGKIVWITEGGAGNVTLTKFALALGKNADEAKKRYVQIRGALPALMSGLSSGSVRVGSFAPVTNGKCAGQDQEGNCISASPEVVETRLKKNNLQGLAFFQDKASLTPLLESKTTGTYNCVVFFYVIEEGERVTNPGPLVAALGFKVLDALLVFALAAWAVFEAFQLSQYAVVQLGLATCETMPNSKRCKPGSFKWKDPTSTVVSGVAVLLAVGAFLLLSRGE